MLERAPMKIIIIDDEIETLSTFLNKLVNKVEIDYKFFKDSPEDSIKYVAENQIDGAFLDIKMPSINGVDLAKKLVKVCPTLIIVFITGYTFNEKSLEKELGKNILGFCYKPFKQELLSSYISQMAERSLSRSIEIKTFGPFDMYVNGKLVIFNSSKAKELLGLLIAYNGSTLTMNDAISHLWPNKNLNLAKQLYRDAVWRLRKTLSEVYASGIVVFQRAQMAIKKDPRIICDYFLAIDSKEKSGYQGVFLPSYAWSDVFKAELDKLK